MSTDDERPWQPVPLAESSFSPDEGWTNINRAPYDRVSGVLYKRAMAVKSVRYEPHEPAPGLPEAWRGQGETVVRWLFSEEPGTAEGLLSGQEFEALQTLALAPGASSGQHNHPGRDTVLCVVAGEGALSHRPSLGAPVMQRPLREGDAVLIAGAEFYSLINNDRERTLHLFVLHLKASDDSDVGNRDG